MTSAAGPDSPGPALMRDVVTGVSVVAMRRDDDAVALEHSGVLAQGRARGPEGRALGPDWRAVVISGPSGSGKSSLALSLIAQGARLIGDDAATLYRRGAGLIATPPDRLVGVVEARGLGLITLPVLDAAEVTLWLELRGGRNAEETGGQNRLPAIQRKTLLGASLPLVVTYQGRGLGAALTCLLRCGALIDPDAFVG